MMMRGHIWSGHLVLLVLMSIYSLATAGLAVMSVDLGSEYMKVAIVKPGVPMEIVLNKESSRKTPTIVAFRDGERHFSSQAENSALKFPQKSVGYLMQVLGRHFDDPQVQAYRKKFPHYNLVKDEERGTVLFKIDEDTFYSPEELLAMILEKAREYAQDFAEQEIKDAVITVPAFYNQAERRAVLTAARLVGINVLQLMSNNAAVALNYGVFRRKNFNATTQYYMFYDIGSTSTTATIVGYNVVKTKEGTRAESNPQLTIKGVGFDRTLGGLEFTLRLRAHLAKIFDNQKKTPEKVVDNHRALAKLMKEAERVKKVLSANADHHAQVENLIDGKDMRILVTRAELEDMTNDLTDRVLRPVEEALKVSEITLPEITEVILMGGGTRMPKIQELLMKYLGRTELGKSLNTDEAAAMGAVYQAAYLGKGFKVKKFGVREGNIYPISATASPTLRMVYHVQNRALRFIREGLRITSVSACKISANVKPLERRRERAVVITGVRFLRTDKDDPCRKVEFEKQKSDDESEDKNRVIRRTLFGRLNPFPQKKVMTFNKHTKDFSFNVIYSGLDFLTEEDRKSFGGQVISRYQLEGVEDALTKNKDKAEARGIKAHFQMDGSGILTLDKVESVFEKNDTVDAGEKSTWSKLGSAIGGLFGGGSDDEPKVEESPETPDGDAGAGEKEPDRAAKAEGGETASDTGNDDDNKQDETPSTSTGTKEEQPETDQDSDSTTDEQKEEGEEKDRKDEEKKEEETDKAKSEDKEESSQKEEKADGSSEAGDSKPDTKATEPKEKVPKVVNIKEIIKAIPELLDVQDFSEDRFKASKKILTDLRKVDQAKVELEQARNELESFIFDLQDKLSSGPFEQCSTEEEKEKLSALLGETSEWFYDSSDTAKKSDFKDKLKTLRDQSRDISKRVYELEERPKALAALKDILNQTNFFLATVKNFSTVDDPIYTQVEMDTMEKLINETVEWRDSTVKAQKKLKSNENPVLLVEDVGQKIMALEREQRYLINKLKSYKPKAKPKDEKKKDDDTDKAEDKNKTTESSDQEDDDKDSTVADEENAKDSKKGDEDGKKSVKKEKKSGTKSKDKSSSDKSKSKSKRKQEEPPQEEEVLELDGNNAKDDGEETDESGTKKSHVEL